MRTKEEISNKYKSTEERLSDEGVEAFIRCLPTATLTDLEVTLIAGNIRNFSGWVRYAKTQSEIAQEKRRRERAQDLAEEKAAGRCGNDDCEDCYPK